MKNTSHTYTQPGSYRLSVEWKYGSMVNSMGAGGVVVFPTADFSASPTSGNAPLTVEFKDISTGSPISWTWNFGDGISSYEQNPVHTYSAAGTYTVIMSVRYGSGTEIKTLSINVLKSTPTITWSNPADISDKTALSGIQLNAIASVPGTFVYTPPAGTILNAGTQTLRADFTPSDTANYNSVSQTATINVLSNNGNSNDNTNNGNHGDGNNGNHGNGNNGNH